MSTNHYCLSIFDVHGGRGWSSNISHGDITSGGGSCICQGTMKSLLTGKGVAQHRFSWRYNQWGKGLQLSGNNVLIAHKYGWLFQKVSCQILRFPGVTSGCSDCSKRKEFSKLCDLLRVRCKWNQILRILI